MQALQSSKKTLLSRALLSSVVAAAASYSQRTFTTRTSCSSHLLSSLNCHSSTIIPNVHANPWSAIQYRGVRVNASHLRVGNVIEKSGRIYQVLEAEQKQRGRGGAILTIELRDVDSGSKQNMRFGADEGVERVFVEDKSFTCLYVENGTAYLMSLESLEQIEVPVSVFGKAGAYLKDEMKTKLQMYDGRPLSGSVPKQVTCRINETQISMKGTTITPRYKRAILDNGLTIQVLNPSCAQVEPFNSKNQGTKVPGYLEPGEEIVVNTEDDSYISRSNK